MLLIYLLSFFFAFYNVIANQCQNGYYNGLPCATTTNYVIDPSKGVACGCDYGWETQYYTAAGNCNLMGHDGDKCSSQGCGKCYRLTTTGDTPPGSGSNTAGQSIVVMLTNVCPEDGNDQWCVTYGNNIYGYQYHFDIAQIPKFTALGWSNPIVTFQQVACGTDGSAGQEQYSNCKWAGAFPQFAGPSIAPTGAPESSVTRTYSNGTCDCTCTSDYIPSPNYNPPTPITGSNPPTPTSGSNPPTPNSGSNSITPSTSESYSQASTASNIQPPPVSPPDVVSNYARAVGTLGGSSLSLWQQCGGQSNAICAYFNCQDAPWSGFSCQTGSCQRLQQWYWQCRD